MDVLGFETCNFLYRIGDEVTKQPYTWSPRLIFGGICTVFDADSEYDGFRAPFQIL